MFFCYGLQHQDNASFLVRVMMVSMFVQFFCHVNSSSLLVSLHICLCWYFSLLIVSSYFLCFQFFVSNNKLACNSRCSLFQCQACLLAKLSCLSLGPMGHKSFAPLELFFSDFWGPALFFFMVFVIFFNAYTKYIWYYPLVVKSDLFSIFHHFQVFVEL